MREDAGTMRERPAAMREGPSAMRLFLVRHGEAQGNREGRYLGWEDPPLTAAGEAQAARLARRLEKVGLRLICSSDLRRARDTAAAIAAPHGLPVRTHPALREAHFGEWSGLTYDEINRIAAERLEAWIADPERQAPPGGETLAQLRDRAATALPRQDGALVVTHGGILRALLSHWTGRPFWKITAPPASLTSVVWDGERLLKVEYLGDTSHVEGDTT